VNMVLNLLVPYRYTVSLPSERDLVSPMYPVLWRFEIDLLSNYTFLRILPGT
jgi:hypothetical protein